MKQKMILIIASLVLAVAGIWGVGSASNTCFSTHNFGSGATLMNICISDHGNLVKFESPAGFQQIGQLNTIRDGYALCSGNLPTFANVPHGYDLGGIESGFGPPTIIQPNGANTFPLTIIRDTTDGVYRLKQAFSATSLHKELTINMTVTRLSTANCTSAGCPPVRLNRHFEGDVDNNTGPNSYFARTKDSVYEWVENIPIDRPEGHGLMLENLKFGVDHATLVFAIAHYFPTPDDVAKGCIVFSGQVATPATPANNLVGRIVYGLSLPSIGSSATRTVVYRRF